MKNNKYIIYTIIFIIIIILFYKYKTFGHYSRLYLQSKYDKKTSFIDYLNYDNNSIINNQFSNIIFFFSFAYTKMPPYYEYTYNIIKSYCEKYNYTFLIFDHKLSEMSPYWLKVNDFYQLSKKYDEKSLFIYLDIDAFVNPKYFNLSIETFLNKIDNYHNKIHNIYIGDDPDITKSLNAGVIILRNTLWSKKLLNIWLDKYNTKIWKFNNNKWSCKINTLTKCDWANEYYEQGELDILYNSNILLSKSNILILHTSVISNMYPIIEDCFIYHFMGSLDLVRIYNIKKILNKYPIV